MQRHRHNQMKFPASEPWIGPGLQQPLTNHPAQMNLPAVFEIMDDFSDDIPAAISRDRRVEVKGATFAIRTLKRAGDLAEKGFGTLGTKRRRNAQGFRGAI